MGTDEGATKTETPDAVLIEAESAGLERFAIPATLHVSGTGSCDPEYVALSCLIVDDNPEFLATARVLLQREGIDVVGVASTVAGALVLSAELRPDVTLADVYLGNETGFDLARQLAAAGSADGAAVILISTYAEKDLPELVADSPAAGFLLKEDLSAAAVRALLGISPEV